MTIEMPQTDSEVTEDVFPEISHSLLKSMLGLGGGSPQYFSSIVEKILKSRK